MVIQKSVYGTTKCVETNPANIAAALPIASGGRSITWLDVQGKISTAELQPLVEALQLHPLVAEDIVAHGQRPKVVYFEQYLFIQLKMLHPVTGERAFASEQLSFILGPNYLISFQNSRFGDTFAPVHQTLRTGKGLIQSQGVDYLFYELINVVVDSYFGVLEKLDEKVDRFEEAIVKQAQPVAVTQLHRLRRDLAYLRKSVWPTREVIGSLERGSSPLISQSAVVYFRDIYDHTIQIIDTIETLRDILSGQIEVYLSTVSNRLNGIIKVLTIITTLFMPLTLVTGIFGMNFTYLPLLDSPAGPLLVVAFMVGIIVMMFTAFRWRKWI